MVEHWREAPGVRGSTPLLGTVLVYLIAIAVFGSAVYSIMKDYPTAQFNLSCHGIYGKFQGKGRKECETCDERFECYTN